MHERKYRKALQENILVKRYSSSRKDGHSFLASKRNAINLIICNTTFSLVILSFSFTYLKSWRVNLYLKVVKGQLHHPYVRKFC